MQHKLKNPIDKLLSMAVNGRALPQNKKFKFLVSVATASAALIGSLSAHAKASLSPSESTVSQRVTLPGVAIIKPNTATLQASAFQSHFSHDSHASHSSHSSHDSHSSHYSGSVTI